MKQHGLSPKKLYYYKKHSVERIFTYAIESVCVKKGTLEKLDISCKPI
jgi:hypothetical protein